MSLQPTTTRASLLEQLADLILQVERPHPLRVAIDGIDAAGKTTLANELAAIIERRGRPVMRASIDGFHRPRAARYQRGEISPEGYYLDSFDYPALLSALLVPLGPGVSRLYRRAVFDFRTDSPINASPLPAPARAILLFDGVFLLRPELNPHWDFRIFVDISFGTCLRRAIQRDISLFGSPEAIRARYEQRYLPAQRHYLQTVRPQSLADVVVDNDDPASPLIR